MVEKARTRERNPEAQQRLEAMLADLGANPVIHLKGKPYTLVQLIEDGIRRNMGKANGLDPKVEARKALTITLAQIHSKIVKNQRETDQRLAKQDRDIAELRANLKTLSERLLHTQAQTNPFAGMDAHDVSLIRTLATYGMSTEEIAKTYHLDIGQVEIILAFSGQLSGRAKRRVPAKKTNGHPPLKRALDLH